MARQRCVDGSSDAGGGQEGDRRCTKKKDRKRGKQGVAAVENGLSNGINIRCAVVIIDFWTGASDEHIC